MTEKRFVDYFDKDHNYIVQDLQNEDEYQVGFVNCDEDELLNLLNALHEENQRGGDPRMEYDEIEKVMKSFMEGYDETESLIDNAFARGYDKGFRQGIDITLRMIKNLYKREGKLNDV